MTWAHIRTYTLFVYPLPPSYKITIPPSFLILSLSLCPASSFRTLQEKYFEMFYPYLCIKKLSPSNQSIILKPKRKPDLYVHPRQSLIVIEVWGRGGIVGGGGSSCLPTTGKTRSSVNLIVRHSFSVSGEKVGMVGCVCVCVCVGR